MQEIPFVLTEWQELNSLLYAPLNATKRVQYTCLAVSTHYIVLGATSGSIYLFTREPCVFQQLIPLLEGAVYRAQISPDEKAIALATVRGSICLISLKPTIKLLTVSSEHLGDRVNCLCWNDTSSEVYAGDETGKISVTVLSTFMTNGIFQSPSYSLMSLDSKIVQMNCASTLLLVSTLNRCYICDTVLEQYKQVGNKPRDGEFGACFLKPHSPDNQVTAEDRKQERMSNVKQVFSMSREEPNEPEDEDCLPKIYCARPGSRIWEVTANGIVVKTHQFKEAFAIAPLPVYKPYIGKLLRLKNQNQTWPVQSINFAQLSVVLQKYLFSYTSSGLYVIDAEKAEVVLWNDEFPDIAMTHIISDKIYLMTSSGVFHCLTLVPVDSLIIKLYDKKSYKECWELCQILRPQLVHSVTEESCDIDIKQSADVPEVLVPIISLIKSNYNVSPTRMDSGIVIVSTGDKDLKNDAIPFSDRKLEERQELDDLEDMFISLNTNGTPRSSTTRKESKNSNVKNGLARNGIDGQKALEDSERKTESDEASCLQSTISNVQTDLESLYLLISSRMKPDISEEHLEGLIEQFFEILGDVKKKYEVSSALQNYLFEVIRSAELHYCNTLLENTPVGLVRDAKNQNVLEQLVKIFVNINAPKYLECPCKFPCAFFDASKLCEPKFLDIGREILRNLSASGCEDACVRVCNHVPSMWRDYLPMKGYPKKRIPDTLLKQCLLSRDSVVMAMVLPALDEQQWKLSAQVFDSIKGGRCANCARAWDADQVGSREFALDWPAIVHLIVKKQGAGCAMTFLLKVHESLPQVVFDRSLYQSIIFSTILSQHGVRHAIELDSTHAEHNSICSPELMRQVVQSLEKDVEGTLNKDALGNGPHHWGMRYNLATSTCPCCTLSLQTPVLLGNNGIALFPCGHAYHVNCMIQKKISRCNLHT